MAGQPAGTYIVEPDGAGLRFVASERDAVWSPNGHRLAFPGLKIVDPYSGEETVIGNDINRYAHLARNRAADLFLDTAPYNAGATAADALWAGLPVVTIGPRTSALATTTISSAG